MTVFSVGIYDIAVSDFYISNTYNPSMIDGLLTINVSERGGVPEPATLLLMGLGLAGLSFQKRKLA